MANYVLWKEEGKWKAKGWELPLGGQHDNEHVLRGMIWADNNWLFCDNKERLICMVKDTTEELLDLDMEPKPGSLWWKSSHKHENMITLRVEEAEAKRGIFLFVKSTKNVKSCNTVITAMGRDSKGAERTMSKELLRLRFRGLSFRRHDGQQAIFVQDDQPTQRLLLKADSCNVALSNMLMTENGTEKLDNELTTTLLENITTLAQLHQYKRADEKPQKITHCMIVFQQ